MMDEYPEDYLQVYQYIFYRHYPIEDDNPFFRTPIEDRDEMIAKQIEMNFSLEDDVVIAATDLCVSLWSTETSRAYEGIKIFLDNMGKSLATEKITFGRDGSATAMLRMAEKYDAVRQSFKGASEDLKQEQSSKVRGAKKLAYDED